MVPPNKLAEIGIEAFQLLEESKGPVPKAKMPQLSTFQQQLSSAHASCYTRETIECYTAAQKNKGSILVLGLALLSCVADGALRHHIGLSDRRSLIDGSGAAVTVFDVTKHGAKADDKTDNAQAFIQTWRAACDSGVPAKVVIPGGTFLTSPVVFQGPCKSKPIVFEVQGNVKATTDLSEYSSEQWILFEIIDGLTLNGGGTFDGQGSAVWKYNDCHENKQCQALPSSIKLSKVNNAFVHEISSVDSKYFHMHVTSCPPPPSNPMSDVGSLGKYKNEEDVSGIVVTNCTLFNTTNGVRIKSYAASDPSQALNITFKDITMDSVKNPIIIDQKYGSRNGAPSRVKISNVHYQNIKGTSTSNVAVSFLCSSLVPCQGVELVDIDLAYIGQKANMPLSASCLNANVKSGGKQNPGCN
ncbi:PREDICTED: exopolygalacturonase clone GBGE184-like [Populus euphratica]|uniref:Exopolygalacturonase clone GBGE184-like n=1 Tax=Populus euphratica TaxID=75702 RepID=A0AAJ6X5I1_POPEU|nr:PREDICTED: exopolygalacturonase clone GBGE184-like [Populus euphratica]